MAKNGPDSFRNGSGPCYNYSNDKKWYMHDKDMKNPGQIRGSVKVLSALIRRRR